MVLHVKIVYAPDHCCTEVNAVPTVGHGAMLPASFVNAVQRKMIRYITHT